MISPKSVLIFVAGCGVGLLAAGTVLSHSVTAHAETVVAGPFVDVPVTHVAAQAVTTLKSKGIVSGYPDGKYHGSSPVTRYELAVTLARFAQYYDTSKEPLATTSVPLPPSPKWVRPSLEYLAANKFVSTLSPTFTKPGTSNATSKEVADDLSAVLGRITDRSMPLSHP